MDNVYPFADRNTIEAEARQWLIKLDGDGEPGQREIAALREWVGRSPAHREELLRISAFWDDANVLTELSIPLHKKTASEGRTCGRFPAGLAIFCRAGTALALCLLGIAAVVGYWFYPQPLSASNGIYATAIGQVRVQTLADRSVIHINTDSQVQVDYSERVRKIRLLRGEAHFAVTPDPERPFEVYAGKGMVKAVGTAFSVRLSADSVKVTVAEGRVDLAAVVEEPRRAAENSAAVAAPDTAKASAHTPAMKKIGSLTHGQRASFSNRTLIQGSASKGAAKVSEVESLEEEELLRRLSWREGYLVFAGEPLSDVVDEVNRYTPVYIEIADPALRRLKVGGRFKVGELEAMFDVLQASFGIQVSRLDDQHIQLQPVQH